MRFLQLDSMSDAKLKENCKFGHKVNMMMTVAVFLSIQGMLPWFPQLFPYYHYSSCNIRCSLNKRGPTIYCTLMFPSVHYHLAKNSVSLNIYGAWQCACWEECIISKPWVLWQQFLETEYMLLEPQDTPCTT